MARLRVDPNSEILSGTKGRSEERTLYRDYQNFTLNMGNTPLKPYDFHGHLINYYRSLGLTATQVDRKRTSKGVVIVGLALIEGDGL